MGTIDPLLRQQLIGRRLRGKLRPRPRLEARLINPSVRVLSLYLDTSVIGGYYDAEFLADTRALWRLKEAGRFRFISSQLVIDEIADAPVRVREFMRTSFLPEEVLDVSVEMEDLAAAYMAQKVVPAGFVNDAHHVAVCSVARIDFLVSWNFKHLANARREAGFNAVNLLQDYPPVRIVAPTFLIHGHEEKEL
jgi:predicted nucleic acid-binding protein